MDADIIIQSPVLTEKTSYMKEDRLKRYVFRVHRDANKKQIITAVHELFSVNPVACNTMIVKGKPKSRRTKSGFNRGATKDWKKAIVTLSEGEKIDQFEGA